MAKEKKRVELNLRQELEEAMLYLQTILDDTWIQNKLAPITGRLKQFKKHRVEG